MPCYLFTWHTYGSWLPDRPLGHVHWLRGREEQSLTLAACYRRQQKEATAILSNDLQRALIDRLVEGAERIGSRLHGVACEPSHVHVLVSWRDDRRAIVIRRSLRRTMTMRLNSIEKRTWFSRGESRRRVEERGHFDHLCENYLPSHSGCKWIEGRGLFR